MYSFRSQSNLFRLPQEIIIHVLQNLPARQLVRCTVVNKKLKRVIDSSLVLQYHIKLTLCGYSDGTRSPRHLATSSTTATRLKRLTKHIDSWNDLDWQMSRVRVPPAEIYELSGGVFASVYEEFLTCVRLPSHVKGTPACKWTHNLGFRPKDIAMDPQQDLLVLVQLQERRPEPDDKPGMIHAVRLHLRSLSDNGPHDEALGPILYGIENFSHRVRFQIQIMGKLLGIAYYDTLGANSQLEIWDWREGRLIVELENSPERYGHFFGTFSSFSFIGPTSFILPRDSGKIEVYDFSPSGEDDFIAHPRATFLLPPTAPSVNGSMEILAEPLPYRHPGHVESAAGTYSAMAEGDDADLTSPKLFDASKDDRLIRIHWQTLRSVRVRPERAVGPEPNGPSLHTFDRSFDLFVPLRVFRDFDGPTRKFSLLTPDVAPDQRFDVHPFDNLIVLQDTLNKTYEWEAWGPENTRFVELPLSERNVFQRHIYGNRYARICPETNGFIMLDFTPYRAEWERRRCASAGSHGFVAERREMIREKRDNIVKQGVHLAADVRTSLPYTYSRRSFGFEVPDDLFGRGVMIDDEHVLCIKENEEDGQDSELIIMTL